MNVAVIEADQAQWVEVTSERGITLTVFKDTLDPINKTGIRTRLVRFHPGGGTREIYTHDYHEEVYLIEGDQTESASKDRPEKTYRDGGYFFRAAHTEHGPFHSEDGCLLFEVHYY
ncbi:MULTISPECIES: DUF4437 domain-containing protein [unclassified Pseudomonas]|uniref:DUF4437 domain-containing protein n=1 Tax=unclassified Pseudomonas TaxID=196821 RepID=UPI000F56A041|nr:MULTISPECIES: DUF4437 domain-containing protein [unclassified Pseudomonas]AZF12329.1 hypothetical protein C4J93_4158 [Pseudomonas sp. R2-37-08W]AZF17612.1 hypothetical protein C4J92_4155 [Pseudomonas sp. R3-18-08]AZF33637.1 hypothetical protein C4J89_4189 [Pseudomonas sp. R4-35-07]AZF54727.1 hypothetical protein C4J85_4269 [Pseudomonas sp. R4-34-07]